LRFALDPGEKDQDLKDSSRALFFRRGSKLPVYCSAPAAGEFLLTLAEDTIREARQADFEEALRKFREYIRDGNLHIYMFGGNPTTALRYAEELHEEDPIISPTDAAIVGCFLSDEAALVLYTTDTDIITSRTVIGKARELGKKIESP